MLLVLILNLGLATVVRRKRGQRPGLGVELSRGASLICFVGWRRLERRKLLNVLRIPSSGPFFSGEEV